MNIVNLTPHEINILVDDDSFFDEKTKSWHLKGEPKIRETIAKGEVIARCGVVEDNDDGLFIETKYTEVEGLPEPRDNTVYVVSPIVKNACPHRNDLVVPARVIRTDDRRTVLGCLRLTK